MFPQGLRFWVKGYYPKNKTTSQEKKMDILNETGLTWRSIRGLNNDQCHVEAYILGGPWDLVTTYNWAYNPTYNPFK